MREKEYFDEYAGLEGLIKNPKTVSEREHNTYLKLLYEYKLAYDKREKCTKGGVFIIIASAIIFLALMLSLDSKAFFLMLWVIVIIIGVAVISVIDYRCYKYERILGLEVTDKEDGLEKAREEIKKKVASLSGEEFKNKLLSMTREIFPTGSNSKGEDKDEKHI